MNRSVPAVCAVTQALVLIVFLSWRFGGMEATARTIAGWLCLPAPIVTWFAWRNADGQLRRHFWRLCWPLLVVAAAVLASLFNPNMRVLFSNGQADVLVARDHMRLLPSTVLPANTATDFLLNAGLVLVGLNLFLARPPRSQQRLLLGVIAVNATVLACVGSIFKLGHATAILGKFPSSNPRFFATFFYYNHWGAFALLGAAAAAGLAAYYVQRAPRGQWQHTPAPLFGTLTALLLVGLALGAGRAAIAAGALFAMILVLRAAWNSLRAREGRGAKLLTTALVTAAFAGTTFWVARDSLRVLRDKTTIQLSNFRTGGLAEVRLPLYRDTWKLFLQKPAFGWGWHSFRYAFRQVQSFDTRMQNEQKVASVFLDAHSDWLQLLAELGLLGAGMVIAAFVGIARTARARWWRYSPCFEIIAVMGCLALLALIDFPFACLAVVVTAWTLLLTGASIAYDRSQSAEAA